MKQKLEFKVKNIKNLESGKKFILTFGKEYYENSEKWIKSLNETFVLKYGERKYILDGWDHSHYKRSFVPLRDKEHKFNGILDEENSKILFIVKRAKNTKPCKKANHKKNCDVCGLCERCNKKDKLIFYTKRRYKNSINNYVDFFGLNAKKTKIICECCMDENFIDLADLGNVDEEN